MSGRLRLADLGLLLVAVSGFCLLATAILQGQPFRGYDAYTHIFFASHYLRSWWDTWEPRWYGGFDVVSYPPLAHQLLALLAMVFGLERAYLLFSLLLIAVFPLAVYCFARALVEPAAARLAGACSLLFPGLALILVPSGQAPGVLSLELLLFAFGAAGRYLGAGSAAALWAFAAGVAASAAAHHATPMLLGPFLAVAVGWRALFPRCSPPIMASDSEEKHSLCHRPLPAQLVGRRLLMLLLVAAAAVLAVAWPFWQWWVQRPAQVPIEHLSRHDFLRDQSALFLGLWLPYSLWLLAVPLALAVACLRRQLAGAALTALLLFLLSLGGTTPLPRWLYGSRWEWLTYERYALWAAVLLLPLAAVGVRGLGRPLPALVRSLAAVGLVTLLLASTVNAAWYGTLQMLEPRPIDLQPVVDFLAEPDHQGWRYLTLGFGDQMSKLSALSSAPSVDGNYNTARSEGWLVQSGIDKLDSSRYWDPQAATLRRYLAEPGPSHLGWVFANDSYYDGWLAESGWRRQALLSNGVVVWSPPQPPARMEPGPGHPFSLRSVWWGLVPLLSLGACLWLFAALWLECTKERQERLRVLPMSTRGNLAGVS